MKRTTKRKGFTLVELLIVIVVIGILSAMMMMSSSEAVSSARASTITSNMRNLQTAALAYWADNMNKFNTTTYDSSTVLFVPTASEKGVLSYLKDDANSNIDYSGYDLKVSQTDTDTKGNWYITYKFDKGRGDDDRVREKVASRAASMGILSGMTSNDVEYKYTATADATIYMLVR